METKDSQKEYFAKTEKRALITDSFVADQEGQLVLFVKNEKAQIELGKTFKEFEFRNVKVELGGVFCDCVEVHGVRSSLEAIKYEINTNSSSLYDALMINSKQFSLSKSEHEKFRGDLGEAIFILKTGGQKLPDSYEADIKLGEALVEVKTYAQSRKTIIISHTQLRAKTDKYAVEIILSDSGMNISAIAKQINGNEEFKSYLLNKYLGSNLDKSKYKLSDPIKINSILVEPNLPEHFIDANYKVSIEKLTNINSPEKLIN